MKLRHAAALVIVGWYLLAAPKNENGTGWDANAPISQWEYQASYDSAAQCMRVRMKIIQRLVTGLVVLGPDDKPAPDQKSAAATLCQCIATDDPRLKPK